MTRDDTDPVLTIALTATTGHQAPLKTAGSLLGDLQQPQRVRIVIGDATGAPESARILADAATCTPTLHHIQVPATSPCSAIDTVFAQTEGWVLAVAPATLIKPCTVDRLAHWLATSPPANALYTGPEMTADQDAMVVNWAPAWADGQFGRPMDPLATFPHDQPPFPVDLIGTGLLCCHSQAWPFHNPRFTTSSGKEHYLLTKARALGHETLCLPFLRWRPAQSAPAPDTPEQRLTDHLHACAELRLAAEPGLRHFRDLLGRENTNDLFRSWQLAQNEPFAAFDHIVCITTGNRADREQAAQDLTTLGIAHRTEWITTPAVPADAHPATASTLAVREALDQAARLHREHLLVLHESQGYLPGTRWIMRSAVRELHAMTWFACSLSHQGPVSAAPTATARASVLARPDAFLPTPGTAYHRSSYTTLLKQLPNTVEGISAFLDSHSPHSTRPTHASHIPHDILCTTPAITGLRGTTGIGLYGPVAAPHTQPTARYPAYDDHHRP